MSKHRHRTKYLLNRRYRRIRRIKFAAALVLSSGLIGGIVYGAIQYMGNTESERHPRQPTTNAPAPATQSPYLPDIRLGGD